MSDTSLDVNYIFRIMFFLVKVAFFVATITYSRIWDPSVALHWAYLRHFVFWQ